MLKTEIKRQVKEPHLKQSGQTTKTRQEVRRKTRKNFKNKIYRPTHADTSGGKKHTQLSIYIAHQPHLNKPTDGTTVSHLDSECCRHPLFMQTKQKQQQDHRRNGGEGKVHAVKETPDNTGCQTVSLLLTNQSISSEEEEKQRRLCVTEHVIIVC